MRDLYDLDSLRNILLFFSVLWTILFLLAYRLNLHRKLLIPALVAGIFGYTISVLLLLLNVSGPYTNLLQAIFPPLRSLLP